MVVLVDIVAVGCGRLGYDAAFDQADAGVTDATIDAPVADSADSTEPIGYCSSIPPLPAAPVIDGMLESGLALMPLEPIGWDGESDAVPEGESAAFAVGWRPDGLYVHVVVIDPTRIPASPGDYSWCGDGVEVYIDADGAYPGAPGYDDPGARQLTTAAPADSETPESTGEVWCYQCDGTYPKPLTSTDFVAVPRPDGYALEMFLAAADLGLDGWVLGAGDDVGFDLAINVSHPQPTTTPCSGSNAGQRLGQYFLRIAGTEPRYPFVNSAAFCTATLE